MIKNYLTSLKQEFSGYNTAKLMKDIMAGLTVCAVALPLALAFGVSSGAMTSHFLACAARFVLDSVLSCRNGQIHSGK